MTMCTCLIYIIKMILAHDNVLQMPEVSQSVRTGMMCLLGLFDKQASNICCVQETAAFANLTYIVLSSVFEGDVIC